MNLIQVELEVHASFIALLPPLLTPPGNPTPGPLPTPPSSPTLFPAQPVLSVPDLPPAGPPRFQGSRHPVLNAGWQHRAPRDLNTSASQVPGALGRQKGGPFCLRPACDWAARLPAKWWNVYTVGARPGATKLGQIAWVGGRVPCAPSSHRLPGCLPGHAARRESVPTWAAFRLRWVLRSGASSAEMAS